MDGPTKPHIILVVEDTDEHRRMFSTVLERAGYVVVQARDGAEALRLAESHDPDLVLLDLSMPVLDGWDTARRLRNGSTRHVRLLACSAEGRIHVAKLREAGFNGLLRKPFVPAQLRRAVAAVVAAEGWVSLSQHVP